LARAWPAANRHIAVDGTLLSADLSGFTRLSERLATLGREGAEELTVLLNGVFTGMIAEIERYGGDVIKFGGDALLVLYTGEAHAERASASTIAMRTLIAAPLATSAGKPVRLRISQGFHSGRFDFFLLDIGHREIVVTGSDATETVECEGTANAGQILMSSASAAHLDRSWRGREVDGRVLLRPVTGLEKYRVPRPDEIAADVDDFVPRAQREQIAVGAPAEHRRVAVGFLKFAHTDQLLAENGPDALGERLQGLATSIAAAAEELGVHVMASDIYPDGGKFILAAGAPVSYGGDEERMLRATRRILDEVRDLDVRIGVNSGPVFVGDLGAPTRRAFTIMGDAVNLAARLMQKAESLQLVASDAALDRSTTRFTTQSLEPFFVKGKTIPILASVVDDAEEGRADQTGRFPMIGRDKELAILLDGAESARASRGRVVELIGEPGAGKTRLLEELRHVEPDLMQATIQCGQYARTSPYFAVRMPLRNLAGISPDATPEEAKAILAAFVDERRPDLAELLPLIAIPFDVDVPLTPQVARIAPQFRSTRSRTAVAELLATAIDAPTLLLVEDVHWVDDASKDLIDAVLAHVPQRPWLVVLTRRPGPDPIALDTEHSARIELEPLSADAALELVIAASGESSLHPADWDRLVERAGGNPLFAIELADAARAQGSADALADSVEALVTSKIDTLPARDRLLLRETAVLGAIIDLELLADALDDPSLLDPMRWSAFDDFLVRFDDGSYRFRHAIHQHVAYEGLSYRRRREMHACAASAIERRSAADLDAVAGLLSTHYHRAGAHSASWRFSVLAGDEARDKYANVEAAEFYSRALESARALSELDAVSVANVAEALGDVQDLIGNYEASRRAFGAARKRLDTEPRLCAELLRKEGRVLEREGRYTQALRAYRRGLTLLEEDEDNALTTGNRAALLAASGSARYRQGRLRDAARLAEQAVADAEASENRPALAHALKLLELCLGELGDPAFQQYRGRALPIYEELDDQVGLADELNNLGTFALAEGRLPTAIKMYELSRRARERAGDVVGEATAVANLGEMMLEQGRFAEARPPLERALRVMRSAGYPMGAAATLGTLGRAEALTGHLEEGLALLDESIETSEQLRAALLAREMRIRKLEVLLVAGRVDDALELGEELGSLAPGAIPDRLVATIARLRAWLFLQIGDDGAASRCVEMAISRLEGLDSPDLALALRTRAELRRRNGEAGADDDEARADAMLESLDVVWTPPLFVS
jgi:class 3 adenylate cyclase/tetratricopeptide (TPR) repeat protein